MRSGIRVSALILIGVLLAQVSWFLAVPPFRGSDEFEHAYRAAGVASGQWRLNEPAEQSRGLLVYVPRELFEAAEPQCSDLPYTSASYCQPIAETVDGRVRVGTAAGGYNPAYYWVIGQAGARFEGAGSLYAMRAASALLCAVGIAAAVMALRSWSQHWQGGRWALVGLFTALSPMLIYTTVVAAPNGLEMVAGLCLWAALLGLGAAPPNARRERWLLVLAITVTPLLMVLRTLGPLWFVAIVAMSALFHGPGVVWGVVRRHRVLIAVGVVVAAASAAYAVAWVTGGGGYSRQPDPDVDTRFRRVVDVIKWTFQMMVGVFPYRDQPAPLWTYPVVMVVLGVLVTAGLRRSRGWGRRGLATTLCLVYLIPMVLVWITLQERGGSWQGRYVLPFAVGALLMIGTLLDRAKWAPTEGPRLRLVAVASLASAHTGSVVHVVRDELSRTVSTSDAGWIQPTALAVGSLMLGGWVCFGLALTGSDPADD